ncbi:MAG: cytochrome c3 family protein [Planctomycetota bacterium]
MSKAAGVRDGFVFPKWANYLLPVLVLGAIGGAVITPKVVFFGLSAETLNPGYMPEQPVPYSHAVHVGQLGLDCRHCHTTVDKAGFAAIPPTETCISCHAPGTDPNGEPTAFMGIKQNSQKLAAVHESYWTGKPIPWVKVHSIADYAYFNHAAHINKGVGCYSCHGRVDQMGEEGVWQVHNLSMGWCLDCHREPEKHLRPVSEVTNMTYHLGRGRGPDGRELKGGPNALEVRDGETLAEAQLRVGLELKKEYRIHGAAYMQACSTCHR